MFAMLFLYQCMGWRLVFAQQKSSFTDSRDGRQYKTVRIGSQTWMAENLIYSGDYEDIGACFGNLTVACELCGKLYNWHEAITACPSGWHLPSHAEWATLEKAVGGSSNAGAVLKSKGNWNNNGNNIDRYGFSALSCGYCDTRGYCDNLGDITIFWSATEGPNNDAWRWSVNANNNGIYSGKFNKSNWFSVRCVKD
jgi:uncharacterized protein (TIGR02145 family)